MPGYALPGGFICFGSSSFDSIMLKRNQDYYASPFQKQPLAALGGPRQEADQSFSSFLLYKNEFEFHQQDPGALHVSSWWEHLVSHLGFSPFGELSVEEIQVDSTVFPCL